MSTFAQENDGDFSIPIRLVTDPDEETALRLTNRFRLFMGEWYLDTRVGVPWYQRILGQKEGNLPAIRTLVENIVRYTPGVQEVVSIDLTYTRASRELSISVRARTQSGAIVAGQLGAPFIVEET